MKDSGEVQTYSNSPWTVDPEEAVGKKERDEAPGCTQLGKIKQSHQSHIKESHQTVPSNSRPCLIKNPGAQKNALLDSHIYPEGSNFIRPPIILSGARNKTVVAVGFSEDRTNTCS